MAEYQYRNQRRIETGSATSSNNNNNDLSINSQSYQISNQLQQVHDKGSLLPALNPNLGTVQPNPSDIFGAEAPIPSNPISNKRLRSSHNRKKSIENLSSTLKDPIQIIKLIRKNPSLGFLYLTPAVERSSIEYNPYNLKYVKISYFYSRYFILLIIHF